MHGIEYLVHADPKSYEEAVSHCSSVGGKLVEPKSDQAHKDIITLAESTELKHEIQGAGIWIGINDKNQEGHFQYESDNS